MFTPYTFIFATVSVILLAGIVRLIIKQRYRLQEDQQSQGSLAAARKLGLLEERNRNLGQRIEVMEALLDKELPGWRRRT